MLEAVIQAAMVAAAAGVAIITAVSVFVAFGAAAARRWDGQVGVVAGFVALVMWVVFVAALAAQFAL